jgi:hypothetical protein
MLIEDFMKLNETQIYLAQEEIEAHLGFSLTHDQYLQLPLIDESCSYDSMIEFVTIRRLKD